jgi:hypothetical protein
MPFYWDFVAIPCVYKSQARGFCGFHRGYCLRRVASGHPRPRAADSNGCLINTAARRSLLSRLSGIDGFEWAEDARRDGVVTRTRRPFTRTRGMPAKCCRRRQAVQKTYSKRTESAHQMSTKRTENVHETRRRKSFLRKRLTPRVRDLFLDLMANRKATGIYLESQCLKVAELTARTEDLRARLDVMLAAPKKGDAEDDADIEVRALSALINSVTRLESTARRAAADLGKIAAEPADPVADLKKYRANKDSSDD